MRWELGRRSDNVEDRRGAGGMIIGGGAGSIVLLLIAMLLGFDPRSLLQQTSVQTPSTSTTTAGKPTDQMGQFVSVVLAETEDVWTDQFRRLGRTYTPPHLVLFDAQVASACGYASAAV